MDSGKRRDGEQATGGVQPLSARSGDQSSATSTDLLAALRTAGNRTAWREYVRRFRPVIVRYARRLGIPKDEAEDAAQQTLIAFSEGFRRGQFDRGKGRLRNWLFAIARNQILSYARRRKTREIQVGSGSRTTGFFDRLPDDQSLETLWNDEWRDAVIRQCLAQIAQEVEPKTMEAFGLFVQKEWPAVRVAQHLGMTPNAVFGSKRRVLARLKELLPQMEELW